MTTTRPYASPLRDEQVHRTRERILDATIATMGRGIAELSVPAVALEAGVSVPTVYRHFGSKRGLLDALPSYLMSKSGLIPDPPPTDLDELRRAGRLVFHRYRELDPTVRAAMASALGWELRREQMPDRLATFEAPIRAGLPELDDQTSERMARILLLLLSSAMVRAFETYFGRTGDDAADDVEWAIRTLVAGARVTSATRTTDGNG